MGTARSWTASMTESHSHWDNYWQKPQSLPGPDEAREPNTPDSSIQQQNPTVQDQPCQGLPATPPAPEMERSVSPPRAPPVHAVTPRTSSP